jgi:hypothetical protein
MRVIIAGGRDITDADAVYAAIKASGFAITEVVSGCATGVDTIGECYAKHYAIPVKRCPADWATNGRAAGPIRNDHMARHADALILVWDGKSRGSANMLRCAKERGLKIHEVKL